MEKKKDGLLGKVQGDFIVVTFWAGSLKEWFCNCSESVKTHIEEALGERVGASDGFPAFRRIKEELPDIINAF